MPTAPLAVLAGTARSYCFQAQKFFARLATRPDSNRMALYDTMIRQLVQAGIWGQLDGLYILAAIDTATAKTNLVQSSFPLSDISTPSFTANVGYAYNGTSTASSTGFDPTTATNPNLTQNSASMGYWSLTTGQTTNGAMGSFNTGGGGGITLNVRNGSNVFDVRVCFATNVASGSSTDGSGWFQVNRTASNAYQVYRNGAQATSGSTASETFGSNVMTIGAARTGGSFSARTISAASMGGSLTADQHVILYKAVRGYLTGVRAI